MANTDRIGYIPKFCSKCGKELKLGLEIEDYNTDTGEPNYYLEALCPDGVKQHFTAKLYKLTNNRRVSATRKQLMEVLPDWVKEKIK